MANFNYNCIQIGGRLTDKPKLQITASGKKMCRFSIATNQKVGGESRTDYFNFVAWEQKAEFISGYFDKGSSIFVVGKLENYTYQDQSGASRYGVQIKVDNAHFVDKKSEMPSSQNQPTSSPNFGYSDSNLEEFKEEDLPF